MGRSPDVIAGGREAEFPSCQDVVFYLLALLLELPELALPPFLPASEAFAGLSAKLPEPFPVLFDLSSSLDFDVLGMIISPVSIVEIATGETVASYS